MKNFVQEGKVVELTAPTGGVVSGTAYKIGALVVIATVSADASAKFNGLVVGVVEVPKVSAQAWAEGELIYFDDGAGLFTTAATTGNRLVGNAVAAAANPSATGLVRLDGAARTDA